MFCLFFVSSLTNLKKKKTKQGINLCRKVSVREYTFMKTIFLRQKKQNKNTYTTPLHTSLNCPTESGVGLADHFHLPAGELTVAIFSC